MSLIRKEFLAQERIPLMILFRIIKPILLILLIQPLKGTLQIGHQEIIKCLSLSAPQVVSFDVGVRDSPSSGVH